MVVGRIELISDPDMQNWWQRRSFAVVLTAVMVLPLLWPAIPPLLDLPGHMGRYAVAASSAGSTLSNFYQYKWGLVGNLGVDLAVIPLSKFLGLETATKVTVMAIPLLMAWGFIWTSQEVHGTIGATAPLALIFTYSYPFLYGFVNYAMGMALVSLGFAIWIRMTRTKQAGRAPLFLAIAALVWVSHAIAWIALCTLCGSFELQQRIARGEPLPQVLARTIYAALPFSIGIVLTLCAAGGSPAVVSGFFDPSSILKSIVSLNRDRWLLLDLATSLALLGILGLAAFRRLGLAFRSSLLLPTAMLLVVFLIVPDSINGSAFIKTRLLPWVAAYALLAIDVRNHSLRPFWALFSSTFLLARLLATGWSFVLYDASFTSALKALDHIPKGSRIATFSVNSCESALSGWTNSRRQHLSGLAIVRRQAFANDQFEGQALQLLKVRYSEAGDFRHSPSEVVSIDHCPNGYPPSFKHQLERLPRPAFDFVWLLDVPRNHWPQREWLKPVYEDGATVLFAVMPTPSPRPSKTARTTGSLPLT